MTPASLVSAHGVMEIQQTAITSVGVGNHAGVHGANERRDAVEHLSVSCYSGVGKPVR